MAIFKGKKEPASSSERPKGWRKNLVAKWANRKAARATKLRVGNVRNFVTVSLCNAWEYMNMRDKILTSERGLLGVALDKSCSRNNGKVVRWSQEKLEEGWNEVKDLIQNRTKKRLENNIPELEVEMLMNESLVETKYLVEEYRKRTLNILGTSHNLAGIRLSRKRKRRPSDFVAPEV